MSSVPYVEINYKFLINQTPSVFKAATVTSQTS